MCGHNRRYVKGFLYYTNQSISSQICYVINFVTVCPAVKSIFLQTRLELLLLHFRLFCSPHHCGHVAAPDTLTICFTPITSSNAYDVSLYSLSRPISWLCQRLIVYSSSTCDFVIVTPLIYLCISDQNCSWDISKGTSDRNVVVTSEFRNIQKDGGCDDYLTITPGNILYICCNQISPNNNRY